MKKGVVIFLFLAVAAVAIVTVNAYLRRPVRLSEDTSRVASPSPSVSQDTDIAANERAPKAGYEVLFHTPVYGRNPEYGRNAFSVDVDVKNISFTPYMTTGGNCDIAQDGRVIRHGSGVQLSALRDIYPGESFTWTMTILVNEGERVTRCSYSPTGTYDPNITVNVKFE